MAVDGKLHEVTKRYTEEIRFTELFDRCTCDPIISVVGFVDFAVAEDKPHDIGVTLRVYHDLSCPLYEVHGAGLEFP